MWQCIVCSVATGILWSCSLVWQWAVLQHKVWQTAVWQSMAMYRKVWQWTEKCDNEQKSVTEYRKAWQRTACAEEGWWPSGQLPIIPPLLISPTGLDKWTCGNKRTNNEHFTPSNLSFEHWTFHLNIWTFHPSSGPSYCIWDRFPHLWKGKKVALVLLFNWTPF